MTTSLDIVLIGCGRRAQRVYFPVLPRLAEHVRVIAVCDPAPSNRAAAAAHFGAPAFDSLAALLRVKPMAAALVVTPPSAHHAVSCLLSAHGIHHLVETPMCDTLQQARDMVAQAERHGVVFRVAEQFWRDPIDLLARQLINAGVIGEVHRITHFQAHLGYHNNSRHQVMAGGPPLAVNAIEQRMPTVQYVNTGRQHRDESFRNRSFHFADGTEARAAGHGRPACGFADGLLITDLAGNIKGALGRYDRPGLMEIDGTHGAVVQEAVGHWTGRAEVRLVPESRLRDGSGGYSDGHPVLYRYRDADGEFEERAMHGRADDLVYLGAHVELPQGRFEVENEFAPLGVATPGQAAFAAVVRDFADLVRTGAPDPFTLAMAVMSLQMELAATLSARRDGVRVALSDPGIAPLDAERQAALRVQLGFDPLDIEAVAGYAFPKP